MNDNTAITGVKGWLDPLDHALFALVDRVQRSAAVRGNILEIGVYEGASAIPLGRLLGPGESLTVCDVFDAPAPTEARTTFEANYLRFHTALPEVLQMLSVELPAALTGRSFRIVHLDASHLYDVTRNDLDLVLAHLAPDGIAIFDDIANPLWPGVAAAVWPAVLAGAMVPLCLSASGKLYATLPGSAITVVEVRRAIEADPGIDVALADTVGGNDLPTVVRAPRSRAKRIAAATVPPIMRRVVRDAARRLRVPGLGVGSGWPSQL
jgi:hypothetical protein